MSDVSLMGKPTIGMNEVDLVLKVNEHHVDLIETIAWQAHLFFGLIADSNVTTM